jgi:hypothetical protein
MTEQEQKDFEWASSYYLYDDLDADWVNWDEEKLHNELENLAWQPFEHWQGKDIYIEIEKLADGVRKYINKENKCQKK